MKQYRVMDFYNSVLDNYGLNTADLFRLKIANWDGSGVISVMGAYYDRDVLSNMLNDALKKGKVKNMVSSKGNPVANQFIITSQSENGLVYYETFQSYKSAIVQISTIKSTNKKVIELDEKYCKYSNTTIKYRNQFLNTTSEEVELKIKSGEYILTDLN